MKPTERGSTVLHKPPPYSKPCGRGIVVEEWGAFNTCRECYSEQLRPAPKNWPSRNNWVGPWQVKCDNCGKVGEPQQVNGKGVLEVQFETGMKSVSRDWLEFL